MEFVELGALSLQEWVGVTDHVQAPFGPSCAGVTFRPKERHVGIRTDGGRLIAVGGATVATVEVEGHEPSFWNVGPRERSLLSTRFPAALRPSLRCVVLAFTEVGFRG
ncbi:MAG TPA: hypothetical protein VLW49_07610 [Gaiellaceae bacterium]|nr:hypothetical protein [Gaiellaceae bacterium]